MDGWMLEMWFFACLRHSGVTLFNENGTEFQSWPQSHVETLDMASFPVLPDDTGIWFKPCKWNQGGFDAIFLEKGKGLVKFVQVTGGESHSFKIEYFHGFLTALLDSPQSFEITNLEIYFVVDKKKLLDFKIADTTGQGLLSVFGDGWGKGKEAERVKIVGIEGWGGR